jgi:hypothetical protein
MRCAQRLRQQSESGRCQLLVGHEGEHVTVASEAVAGRIMLIWSIAVPAARIPFDASVAASRPWAPGLPRAERIDLEPADIGAALIPDGMDDVIGDLDDSGDIVSA